MTADTIKSTRLKYHISQSKLAKILQVHPASVSQWEAGKTTIPSNHLAKIEELFKKIDDGGAEDVIKQHGLRIYRQNRYDVPTPKTAKKEKKNQQLAIIDDFDSSSNLRKVELDLTKPKAIALFAGCGGMSQGIKKAGYQVVGYAEIVPEYRKIYEENFSNTALLGKDVCNITDQEITKWKDIVGEIDLLAGGPPCQGFSLAGKRDVLDPRNRLYVDYVRIAKALRPKVVLMENVRLLNSMKTPDGRWVKDDIREKFEEIGYQVVMHEINAKQYGVPQSRERVLFLAYRNDLETKPSLPKPTHGANLLPYRTFRDATKDLERLESGDKSSKDPMHFAVKHPQHVVDFMKIVPEGESAHNNIDPKMRPSSGFNTTYKRIKWDEPSSTITTNFSMISGSRNVHPTDTRSLTTREAMRCQTFPDDYKFVGKWGAIRGSIGNAVPPHLAEIIASHILKETTS